MIDDCGKEFGSRNPRNQACFILSCRNLTGQRKDACLYALESQCHKHFVHSAGIVVYYWGAIGSLVVGLVSYGYFGLFGRGILSCL